MEKHPEYWRDWRSRHPDYVERNRELQKARDRVKAELAAVGPMLSPPVASGLGVALNQAAGLPLGALNGPGFLSNAACCPWGKPIIGKIRDEVLGRKVK